MTTQTIERLIRELAGGTFFSVTFRKRTTGELRDMVCRIRPPRQPAEGHRPYDPSRHGLLTVWDAQCREYRTIPLDAIRRLRIRGETYES